MQSVMISRACVFCLLLVSCRPSMPMQEAVQEWALLDPVLAIAWQPAGIPEEGPSRVEGDTLIVTSGQPMTGTRFSAWDAQGLPRTNYVITYEAMRAEGEDIFGMCTFPVGSHDSHATFVLGGWGGTVTGISSIDFKDANENSTRGEQRFENERWQRVRIEVRPDDLRAWVNDRPVVNASIKGRKVTLRPGYIDHCVPFGFATWGTTAKVRRIIIQRLTP